MSEEIDLFMFSDIVEDASFWLLKKPENSRILRLMQREIGHLAEASSNEDIAFLNDFLGSFINQVWNNLAVDFTYQSGSPGRRILLALIRNIGKELKKLAAYIREEKDYHPILLRLSNLYQKSLCEIREKEDVIAGERPSIGKVKDWAKVPPQLRAFCHVLQDSGVITQSEYTLAGGSPSNYFFDADKMMSKPEYVEIISDYFAREIITIMTNNRIDKLAFIEKDVGTVGILPLMSLIISKTRVNAFIVRLRKQVSIGIFKYSLGVEPHRGEVIAIVSDVATSGEGISAAADAIRKKGALVPFAFVLYDREQGAKERLEKDKIILRTVTSHAELAALGIAPSKKGPILENRIPVPTWKIEQYSTGMDPKTLRAEEKIVIGFKD